MRLTSLFIVIVGVLNAGVAEELDYSYLFQDEWDRSGAEFKWNEARNRVFRILNVKETSGRPITLSKSNAVFISAEGHFLSMYYPLKSCLKESATKVRKNSPLECYDSKTGGLVGSYKGKSYPITILSHPKAASTTLRSKSLKAIFRSDHFIVGQLKDLQLKPGEFAQFNALNLFRIPKNVKEPMFNLLPPEQVFVPGWDSLGDFTIATGFANAMDTEAYGMNVWPLPKRTELEKFSEKDPKAAAMLKVLDEYKKLGFEEDAFTMRVEREFLNTPVLNKKGELLGFLIGSAANGAAIIQTVKRAIEVFFTEKENDSASFKVGEKTHYLLHE